MLGLIWMYFPPPWPPLSLRSLRAFQRINWVFLWNILQAPGCHQEVPTALRHEALAGAVWKHVWHGNCSGSRHPWTKAAPRPGTASQQGYASLGQSPHYQHKLNADIIHEGPCSWASLTTGQNPQELSSSTRRILWPLQYLVTCSSWYGVDKFSWAKRGKGNSQNTKDSEWLLHANF